MLLFANADITIEDSVCINLHTKFIYKYIYIYIYMYIDIYDKKPFIKQ